MDRHLAFRRNSATCWNHQDAKGTKVHQEIRNTNKNLGVTWCSWSLGGSSYWSKCRN